MRFRERCVTMRSPHRVTGRVFPVTHTQSPTPSETDRERGIGENDGQILPSSRVLPDEMRESLIKNCLYATLYHECCTQSDGVLAVTRTYFFPLRVFPLSLTSPFVCSLLIG